MRVMDEIKNRERIKNKIGKCPKCSKLSKIYNLTCKGESSTSWSCKNIEICKFNHQPPCFWCKYCQAHFKPKWLGNPSLRSGEIELIEKI